jgi:MSHA biogenesis protein MshL
MKQQQSSNASGLPGTVGTPLGGVLGQRSRANMKSELVMLLKPTIIRGESGWQSDVGDVNERLRGFESPKPAQEARAARPR